MLSPRQFSLVMSAVTWWVLSGAAGPAVGAGTGHPSTFRGDTPAGVHRFAAAQFTPSVAPVISKSKVSKDMRLSWQEVTIAPGATVKYTVTRWRNGANPVAVCTGSEAPVTAAGTVTCTDTAVPNGSLTYSEQPVVVRNGTPTWSLPASVPA